MDGYSPAFGVSSDRDLGAVGEEGTYAIDLVVDPFSLDYRPGCDHRGVFCAVCVRWPALFSFTDPNVVGPRRSAASRLKLLPLTVGSSSNAGHPEFSPGECTRLAMPASSSAGTSAPMPR
jgi:hypothetical protein